jgi:hypothetical protein
MLPNITKRMQKIQLTRDLAAHAESALHAHHETFYGMRGLLSRRSSCSRVSTMPSGLSWHELPDLILCICTICTWFLTIYKIQVMK